MVLERAHRADKRILYSCCYEKYEPVNTLEMVKRKKKFGYAAGIGDNTNSYICRYVVTYAPQILLTKDFACPQYVI